MLLSVKDFKAPEYNLPFAVFRLMPSKVAISNGTGASGNDNALSILIAALYYCEFAVRRPKMSHGAVISLDFPLAVTQGRIGTYNFVVPGLSQPSF